MQSEKTTQLGTKPILSLVILFSLPSIVGMLVNAIYNIVDRIFIGKYVGEDALAGLTINFALIMVMFAVGALIGIGGSALISIKLGEQENEQANEIFNNMISLTFISIAIVLAIGYIFMEPLLHLVGGSANTIPYAKTYLEIILVGMIFQIPTFAMASLARVEGRPTMAMLTQIASAVINIILDYVFIVIIPWGVQGAAVATVLSQIIGFLILFHYFFLSKKSFLHFKRKYLIIKKSITNQIMVIGSSSFFLNVGNSLTAAIMNGALLKYGGDAAITSLGAIHSIFTLALMPILGLQQGLGPIIGYNYGMKQFDRVKKALYTGIGLGFSFATFFFILIQIWPATFASLFLDPASKTMEMCINGLRIQMLALPLVPIVVICTAFFQSTAKGSVALILSFCRQIAFLIPAIFVLPLFFDLNGIWLSMPITDVLAVILSIIFIKSALNQHNKQMTKV